MKSNFLLTMRFALILLISVCMSCKETHVSPSNFGESKNGRVSSYTVRQIFQDMQAAVLAQGNNVGGSEGLYSEASAAAAFADMAQGYDKKTATSVQIEDNDGNIWRLYAPSAASVTAFSAQNITIKKSIDWSTVMINPGPTRKKLRFTND